MFQGRGIATGQQYPRAHSGKMLTVRPTCDENLQISRVGLAYHFPATAPAVVIIFIFVAFRRTWRSAYFLALPAIPPFTLKNHFSFFAG
jgi:hypothetical protein